MNAPRAPRILAPLVGAVVRPLQRFFQLEASSGILLLLAAVVAFVWANWPNSTSYRDFVALPIGVEAGPWSVRGSLNNLINDGLMTVFFFVVGLEIKRELTRGELRTPARAALPAIAALGGMFVPAAVFLAFTHGQPGSVGWGIPMATDIAFTIGCLALLRSRVPHGLVVFVTALAIFDDIGGILVIALFYGTGLHSAWLLWAALITAGAYAMNRLHVTSWIPYAITGLLLWYALHHSGIHATIAGVVLGMTVPSRASRPARDVLSDVRQYTADLADRAVDDELASAEVAAIENHIEDLQPPLDRFVHVLHPIVAFGLMPSFALVNAGVKVTDMDASALWSPVALGVGLGLLFGKQVGIFVATFASVRLGFAPMPAAASVSKLYGVSVVAGIGFTVAIFIATLAYEKTPELLDEAKIGILIGSALAGLVGMVVLRMTARTRATASSDGSDDAHGDPR